MNTANILPLVIFLISIVAQAVWPARRLRVVFLSACACIVTSVLTGTLGMTGTLDATGTYHAGLWERIPWTVISILICLGLLTQAILPSNALGRLSVLACRGSRGSELGLLVIFPVLMFALSCAVNNLAAMQVVMPILLTILKVLGPRPAFVHLLMAAVLVACNLGGAATPIGDFPAVLLLGQGLITFNTYLVNAGPASLAIFAVFLIVLVAWQLMSRPGPVSVIEQRLAVDSIKSLYRHTRIHWPLLLPAVVSFCGMVVAWSKGAPPDLVALLGVALVLLCAGARGETILRKEIEVEPVLYLVCLFTMIAIIDATGILNALAAPVFGLSERPIVMACVFMVVAGVLTGIFSAGPSMAALLPIAKQMTAYLPADAVYVGLALSVCAGSSLFLTAATSGPLAQCLVGKAQIVDAGGKDIQFGFREFLRYGLVSFLVIETGAIAFVLITT